MHERLGIATNLLAAILSTFWLAGCNGEGQASGDGAYISVTPETTEVLRGETASVHLEVLDLPEGESTAGYNLLNSEEEMRIDITPRECEPGDDSDFCEIWEIAPRLDAVPASNFVHVTTHGETVSVRDDYFYIVVPFPASFTYAPSSPEEDEEVIFEAADPRTPKTVGYLWDFGDGTPPASSDDTAISHRFTKAGTYDVLLTVTDEDQLSDEANRSITVVPAGTVRYTLEVLNYGAWYEQDQVGATGVIESEPAGIDCETPYRCNADFIEGTEVTLSATPDAGFTSGPWMGDDFCDNEGGDETGRWCTVTLDRNMQITGTFQR